MKLVIIESPLRAVKRKHLERNLKYAYAAATDSLKRGEAPFASHILYPSFLNDGNAEERRLGMESGWAWMRRADLVAVYQDLGISEGMQDGINAANNIGLIIEYRNIRS